MVGIGNDIIINFSYGKTTQAKELFDFIDGLSGGIKGCYRIQWNTEEGASYLTPYDCLFSYLDKELLMYLVIKIAGGAKGVKVIKTVLEGNVRDLSCVDTSDKSTSESVIIQSQKLTTFKVEDVKAVFTSLPLETLQEMEAYLTKHKATANVKAQGVISFIPAIKDMDAI